MIYYFETKGKDKEKVLFYEFFKSDNEQMIHGKNLLIPLSSFPGVGNGRYKMSEIKIISEVKTKEDLTKLKKELNLTDKKIEMMLSFLIPKKNKNETK